MAYFEIQKIKIPKKVKFLIKNKLKYGKSPYNIN